VARATACCQKPLTHLPLAAKISAWPPAFQNVFNPVYIDDKDMLPTAERFGWCPLQFPVQCLLPAASAPTAVASALYYYNLHLYCGCL